MKGQLSAEQFGLIESTESFSVPVERDGNEQNVLRFGMIGEHGTDVIDEKFSKIVGKPVFKLMNQSGEKRSFPVHASGEKGIERRRARIYAGIPPFLNDVAAAIAAVGPLGAARKAPLGEEYIQY